MLHSAIFRACLVIALPLATAGHVAAAQSPSLEMGVKAAFLPKFAAYVNWPSGALGAPDEPIQLCVIGRDSIGSSLDEVAGRERIDQHPVQVRRLNSTAEAGGCHIAFLGGTTKESPGRMLEALQGQPVLTVTDARGGADRGIVHFVLQGGRVRFHIDDALAARSNLGISARLLSLAVSVRQRARA